MREEGFGPEHGEEAALGRGGGAAGQGRPLPRLSVPVPGGHGDRSGWAPFSERQFSRWSPGVQAGQHGGVFLPGVAWGSFTHLVSDPRDLPPPCEGSPQTLCLGRRKGIEPRAIRVRVFSSLYPTSHMSPKRYLHILTAATHACVTLFGNRIFADVIEAPERSSSWIWGEP